MSSIILTGDTSGSITLASPAVAGSNTITLPALTGTPVIAGQSSAITAGTAVASTSGTSIDFTGIPSWVKRITVMFNGVSTNGSSLVIAKLGTSGGIVSTGYASSVAYCGTNTGGANTTVGLIVSNPSASDICSGQLIISNISGNVWVASGTGAFTTNVYTYIVGGNSPALASVLTTVRITTVNGTDTFDAGSINILYE